MRKQINLICAILALFCLISMYVPVIAPRYPAANYYAPVGDTNYFYTGEYYLTKAYWNITDYVFANLGIVGRIVLSLDQALLLVWAWMSVTGKGERKQEMMVAACNLLVVSVALIRMLMGMWACLWGVLITIAVLTVMGVVMAANAPLPQRQPGPLGEADGGRAAADDEQGG